MQRQIGKLSGVALVAAAVLLSACADKDFSDLDAFMASKRDRPGGVIAPIPTFKAYEAFSYSATTLRSPFDRPVEVREIVGEINFFIGKSLRVDGLQICGRKGLRQICLVDFLTS